MPQTIREHLRETRQGSRWNLSGLLQDTVDLALRNLHQALLQRIRHCGQHQQITHPAKQIRGKPRRILTRHNHTPDHAKHGRTIARCQRLNRIRDDHAVSDTENGRRRFIIHAIGAGTGNELIHNR